MNIMKWNKIIAEFMGYKLMPCNNGKAWDIGKSIPSKDHLLPIQGVLHTGNELKFHTSWDWLMPVIEKIEGTITENGYYDVRPHIDRTTIVDDCFHIYIECDGDNRFMNTYKAVVEFIKQYNDGK